MKSIYELGLNKKFRTERLGCVMIDTTSPLKDPETELPSAFVAEQYFSKNPNLPHINGIQKHHHTTVRYGFDPSVTEEDMRIVADVVAMRGDYIRIKDFEIFDSKIPEEQYECVVALLETEGTALRYAHEQFGVLPNLVTFPYRAHVTLGYFRPGFWNEYGVFHAPLRDGVYLKDWKFSPAGVFTP